MFLQQQTNNAHSGQIPEHLWKTISEHKTHQGALQAQAEQVTEMKKYTGPNAWSNNFRIITDTDSERTVIFTCMGGVLAGRQPECQQEASVTYTWPADETNPSPPLPPGWNCSTVCAVCSPAEEIAETAEIAKLM